MSTAFKAGILPSILANAHGKPDPEAQRLNGISGVEWIYGFCKYIIGVFN